MTVSITCRIAIDSIDKLYSDANAGATTAADELDRQATAIGKQTEKYTEIRNTLAGILEIGRASCRERV